MNAHKKFLLGLLTALSISSLNGCAQDIASRYYGNAKYAPKPPSEVQILWKRPDREFQVIADFQSRGESPEDMRNKAAKLGADAVIVQLLGGYATYDEYPNLDKQNQYYSRIAGTAIIYTQQEKK